MTEKLFSDKKMSESCMIGWSVTICACLLAIVSVSAMLYWIVRSIQIQKVMTTSNGFSKFNKKLLVVNGSSIVVFTVVSVIIGIHCTVTLHESYNSRTNIDFINDFESTNIQLTLTLSAFFYLIGKLLVYIVLYLRLHYALKESLFAYSDIFYIKLKIIISICIISALLSLVFGPFNFILGMYIFFSIYAILDIVIPIRLNILFINKLHQIGNFMINLRPSQPQQTNKITVKQQQKQQKQQKEQPNIPKTLYVTTESEHASQMESTNIDNSANSKTANLSAAIENQSEKSTNTDDKNSSGHSGHHAQKKYEKLFSVLSRFSILGSTITISSLLYLLIVVITIIMAPQEEDDSGVLVANIGTLIRWTLLSVDACINSICLILYFEYILSLYNIFCYSCNKTDCAKNCLITCCLCKCGCCKLCSCKCCLG